MLWRGSEALLPGHGLGPYYVQRCCLLLIERIRVEGRQNDLVPVAGTTPAGREQVPNRLYTVSELMRLTGMSRKQVGYWADIGLVEPSLQDPNAAGGRPSYFYSATQVLKAMVFCDLRRRGYSLRQVRDVARNLRDDQLDLSQSQAYLLTDGYSVYYAFSDGEAIDVLKHHRQGLLLVQIHEHVAKLREVA
jgi:DNA-binding transcriptional MerR regulator